MVRSSFFNSVPSDRSAAATTTGCVGAETVLTGWVLIALKVAYARPPPATIASASTTKIRLRIGISHLFVPHDRRRRHRDISAHGARGGDEPDDRVEHHEREGIVHRHPRSRRRSGQRHVAIEQDVGVRQRREAAAGDVVADAVAHVGVRRTLDHRHARPLARRVGQHLPRLIGAAEFENPDADQQDDRHRDGSLEERRAALVTPADQSQFHGCTRSEMKVPAAIAGPYANRLPRAGATIVSRVDAGDVINPEVPNTVSASRPRRVAIASAITPPARAEYRNVRNARPGPRNVPTAAISFTSPAPVAPITWPGSMSSSPVVRPSSACSGVTPPPPNASPNPAPAIAPVSQFGMRRVRTSVTTAAASPSESARKGTMVLERGLNGFPEHVVNRASDSRDGTESHKGDQRAEEGVL